MLQKSRRESIKQMTYCYREEEIEEHITQKSWWHSKKDLALGKEEEMPVKNSIGFCYGRGLNRQNEPSRAITI